MKKELWKSSQELEWLNGLVVWFLLRVQEVPGSNPGWAPTILQSKSCKCLKVFTWFQTCKLSNVLHQLVVLVTNLRPTWYLSGARGSLRIELFETGRPIFRISQPGSLLFCTFVCQFVGKLHTFKFFCASYSCQPALEKNDTYLEIVYHIKGMLLCKNDNENNERERQRVSDRAFQHFGLSFYQKYSIDLDRTRTCNPQIRSLVPYPLGHKVSWWKLLGTWR